MRFRRWDPGRVRVGNEKDIPNLHQDYGTRKQRKEQDDFIRGDLSGLSGFRGIFEKIGIVWGCDLLTESTDLGSSIGGVFDNQDGVIGLCFKNEARWYMVLVSVLEMVLRLVSSNQMQIDSSCYNEDHVRIMGLFYHQLCGQDNNRYNGDALSAQWSTSKHYQAKSVMVLMRKDLWSYGAY
ncbi:PREDICTED: uncharacterized protein LOC106325479 [Brassica oleracea var. oleracea]|uniref:uncharacterized protein LOC106325479 n=1 Tax=Brassica oleracea var. oleracea TaxID=109376 RepID=UPI0006A7361D|nr:PREDICTED: uncharacterized protein LOC106325479 [Brassica oleracea var. oleracea]